MSNQVTSVNWMESCLLGC